MEHEFKARFNLRYDECGASGYLRPSVYLCYTQEAATRDAWPVSWADSYWVVRRTRLLIHRPLTYPASLTVTTWVPGFVRTLAQRAYSFTDAAGQIVAEAESLWVNLNPATLRPARVPAEVVAIWFPDGDVPPPAAQPAWPTPPVQPAHRTSVMTGYSWLDGQRRVNNACYLDLLDNAGWHALIDGGINLVQFSKGDTLSPSLYDVEYHNAAGVGERFSIDTWFADRAATQFECLQEIRQGQQLIVRSRAIWQWRERAGVVAPLPAAVADLVGAF